MLYTSIDDDEFNTNYIAKYGQLYVRGTKLETENGRAVQLKGLSSHGIGWYSEYTSEEALRTIRQYGANVFRVAMYTDADKGYIDQPDENKQKLYQAVDVALELGIYAIVDWHILKDSNPLTYKKEAKDFFDEVSKHYKNHPGVIYEICNEPNGGTTWHDIKKYAEEIIPIIRKNSPNAIIIVGTPKYSSNLDEALEEPLPYENIVYSMHKYFKLTKSRGYKKDYLDKLISSGLPVFVSEWGVDYDDLDDSNISSYYDDRLDFREAEEFADYLKKNGISWCYWSLSNKAEDHSVILSSCDKLSDWNKEDMTPSGYFVFSLLKD